MAALRLPGLIHMNVATSRLGFWNRNFVPKTFTLRAIGISSRRRTTANMTTFNIDSKVKMNSGYEIPLLGYGVSLLH